MGDWEFDGYKGADYDAEMSEYIEQQVSATSCSDQGSLDSDGDGITHHSTWNLPSVRVPVHRVEQRLLRARV